MTSFDPTLQFYSTSAPDVNWKPGQGCNSTSKNEEDIPFKRIEPGKTEMGKGLLYRIMLGGIVSQKKDNYLIDKQLYSFSSFPFSLLDRLH